MRTEETLLDDLEEGVGISNVKGEEDKDFDLEERDLFL